MTEHLDDDGGRRCLEQDCIDERTRLTRATRRGAWWVAFTGVVFEVEVVASVVWYAAETRWRRVSDPSRR